jgi:hypothetical protein
MVSLTEIFSSPDQLTDLEPEELGGVLLEVVKSMPRFTPQSLATHAYPLMGRGAWSHGEPQVVFALSEAVQWLLSQGLAMRDPDQPGLYYVLTRRGRSLKTPGDVEAYRKGAALPVQLLQPRLAEKVHHLFVRGDHDIAVLQAFKEVEVAVRRACSYSDELYGKGLMQKAFAVNDGPLRNPNVVIAEREAEFYLFAGAMGHCKNPASHRDVNLNREEAARRIVFASHLLAIVAERTEGVEG